MGSKRKILCVVGTRPEAIKVAPVVLELQKRADAFTTEIMATAQHRELLDQVLALFAIRPDVDLDIMRPGQTLTQVTCAVLCAMEEYLATSKPDIVLAQGDTTTVMATATACYYARIPFGHIEAGLRTGNKWAPYPEEINRRVVALIAGYHFAPTQRAAKNLRREGCDENAIYVTGNTVIDALYYVLSKTEPPPRPIPVNTPYILMTCHRREIFGDKIREVFEAVHDFAQRHEEVFFWYPVHPNPNVKEPAYKILSDSSNIVLTEPLDYVTFCHAMNGARLLLSDSGGVQEEALTLGKPVLLLRDTTERPEGVEAGTCLLVGPHRERIEAALMQLLHDPKVYEMMARGKNTFGDGHAAERIVSILNGEKIDQWCPENQESMVTSEDIHLGLQTKTL